MDRRTFMIGSAAAAAFAATSMRALAQGDKGPRSLQALFDQFVKENLDISPSLTSSLGLDKGARAKQKCEIDDASLAGVEAQKKQIASQLSRLRAFDRGTLSPADGVSYDVVPYGLRATDEANRVFNYGPGGAGAPYVISQLTGSYQDTPPFLDTQHTIETKADADAYLARLGAFARQMNQEVEVARHDMGLGVIPPDFILVKTLTQMQAMRALSPETSSLTESVVRRTRAKNIPGDYGRKGVSGAGRAHGRRTRHA
jgi:uncharacterized protein (DUF885 family)